LTFVHHQLSLSTAQASPLPVGADRAGGPPDLSDQNHFGSPSKDAEKTSLLD
jgi:hypothetical protein